MEFVVMTLLGPNLSQIRRAILQKVLPPVDVALVAVQTLEAIEDMHDAGYVHRDIKSAYLHSYTWKCDSVFYQ